MSRNLHQKFDGISSTEGIPTFLLEYAGHSQEALLGLVDRCRCSVYETAVRVVFKDEDAYGVLGPSFRNHTVVGNSVIMITLYFPDPSKLQLFSSIDNKRLSVCGINPKCHLITLTCASSRMACHLAGLWGSQKPPSTPLARL
jgi:hypothetical protein